MEAQIITDCQLWNDFVGASACCNVTQSYEWGELAHHLGCSEVLRVGIVDDAGQLCAAMLVLVMHAPILKSTYFYAPRGPVIDDPEGPALALLLNFIKVEARKRQAFMLKVEPSIPDGDLRWLKAFQRRGFRPNPYATHVRHEWVLDIRPSEQALLAEMKEKWRYNIRLASRKGVTVRQGQSQADLDTFYHIYETTSVRDQFFIHDKSHYQDILRMFGEKNRSVLLLAEYDRQAIAGTITVSLGRWSWYMFGASANEHRERMPNHLLQWSAIQWARSQGCWYYNFRGIPDTLVEGEELWGVYVFKRGFGGYPIRFLETHDLVYQPLLYEAYRCLLEVKHWNDTRRRKHSTVQEVIKG
jgi:lipid II:glycine glycyltransferase (peptidoglycan interpeptide bridge formation enzyme)